MNPFSFAMEIGMCGIVGCMCGIVGCESVQLLRLCFDIFFLDVSYV